MNDTLRFAQNLKLIRKGRGLTQEQLAKMIGLTSQSIINYEKGTTFPTGNRLEKLLEVLEVDSEQLLGKETRYESEKKMLRFIDNKARIQLAMEELETEEEKREFLLAHFKFDKMDSESLYKLYMMFMDEAINNQRYALEKDLKNYIKTYDEFQQFLTNEECVPGKFED